MAKTTSIRETLGLTQDETAMLLRINKGQLAMYEIGKRDLPVAAKLKLVAMMQFVQNKEKNSHLEESTSDSKMAKIVAQELRVNQHKQLRLEQSISRFKNKYQKCISALQLVKYLESDLENSNTDVALIEMIRRKALKGIEKNGLSTQIKWDLQLNALLLHEKELQKALKQYKTEAVS